MGSRILILFLLAAVAFSCHYSCSTCFQGDSFTNCTTCLQGNLTILQDPDIGQPTFFNYHRFTGTCNTSPNSPVNGFGIALLTIGVFVAIFTRKREAFMFLSSIQNIAFISFLNVSFASPLSYILEGLQYLLLFSKAQIGQKWTDNWLKLNTFYNLQTFLGTVDYITNILALDVVIGLLGMLLLSIVLVEGLCIHKVEDPPKRKLIKRVIKRCAVIMKYIFYFTIAEHFMLGTLSIRGNFIYPAACILFGFYIAVFLYFCVYCYYRSIKFFGGTVQQFWNIGQKVLYGVLVAFPISPLVLPLVMAACVIAETLFQWKRKGIECRWLAYRIIQCTTILVSVAYIAVELPGTNPSTSKGLAALTVVAISLYSLVPLVQVSMFIYYRYILKKVAAEKNQQDIMKGRMITEQLNLNATNHVDNTKELIVYQSEANDNLEQIQLDMANADNQRQGDIYQFEDQEMPEKKDDQEEGPEPITGKKLKQSEAAATAMKFNPKDNVIEMMNMTQKSPKRKRPPRDPARENQLKLAYGVNP